MKQGFSLMEMIVGIGILSILGASIAPVALEQMNKAKILAAKNDVISIDQAITNLREDTTTDPGNCTTCTFRVLHSQGGIEPSYAASMSGSLWDFDGTSGDTLVDHLTLNTGTLYPSTGENTWQGPYLLRDPVDPWGGMYIVFIDGSSAQTDAGFDNQSVWILSAGKDQVVETHEKYDGLNFDQNGSSITGTEIVTDISDDDIGRRIIW